jgi:hypothetical protein
MKHLLFVALAVGLGGSGVAGAGHAGAAWDQAPSVAGMSYDAARRALRKSGVRPVALKHDTMSIVCDDDFCRENPEVIDCSTDHLGDCSFAWQDPRNKTYLVVETHGDGDVTVDDLVVADADQIARIEQSR